MIEVLAAKPAYLHDRRQGRSCVPVSCSNSRQEMEINDPELISLQGHHPCSVNVETESAEEYFYK